MFLGFYQLGDLIPLRCFTRDGSRVPTQPDVHPYARVTGENGTVYANIALPLYEQQRITGYFHHLLSLAANFTEQRYTVVYTWVIGGTVFGSTEEFEVVPGGASSGAGIAAHFFRQASSDYVLLQDDSGTLKRLRGPEVRNV